MNTLSLIRWAGGKGKQLNDLLPLIPHSPTYVEPFGGGASVLLNRERMECEVYNDLDHALVNLFSVLRGDDTFAEFAHRLDWVLYSRSEFADAVDHFDDITRDAVDQAVLFYTMLNQAISGKRLAKHSDWGRTTKSIGTNRAEMWAHKREKLWYIHDRLQYVQIECRDALDVIQEWDGPGTVYYCDPPYILETRKKRKYYAVEPGDDYHEDLVKVLLDVQGMVVLSGYDHPIYTQLLDYKWQTDLYGANATMDTQRGMTEGITRDRTTKRTEIVYRNPAAVDMGVMRKLPFSERI